MSKISIRQAVENFTVITSSLSDQDLELPWKWGDYEEGIRFAFFRIYEELRQLSTRLEAQRATSNNPMTTAQNIMLQYHLAYRDLHAILLDIGDNIVHKSPAEDEWSVWRTLVHMISAERTFFAINHHALTNKHKQDDKPSEMSDEAWEAFWNGDSFDQIKDHKSIFDLIGYHELLHQRILREFADITDDELGIDVIFWEKSPMPIEFRLHRFDSHLRQHTIQIEKILVDIAHSQTEARRLLRLIFNALAECEGLTIGDWDFGVDDQMKAAERLTIINNQVSDVLAQSS